MSEKDSTSRKAVVHLFWAILASLVLLSLLFYVVGLLPIGQTWKDILRSLWMVTLGAVIASVIHELLLGSYYKEQSRNVIRESVAPSF